MTSTLFDIAGLAVVGWALMILLPGWSLTRRLVGWSAFPVLLSAVYVVGVVAMLSKTGLGVVADFGSAEGVIGLLSQPDIALLVWIHVLAFDHLVGVFIFRDNQRHKVVPLPIQSLLLLLTLMFGPAGFLMYWAARVARQRNGDLGALGTAAQEV